MEIMLKANLLTNNLKNLGYNTVHKCKNRFTSLTRSLIPNPGKDLLKMTANIIKVNNYNGAFRGTAIKKSIVKV